MAGFVKLDCAILESTIWAEPDDVLRVWIALLAKADSFGVVRSTLPAMANQCRTTLDRMHQILELFKAPDPYSRTPDNEGRRLEEIEGGWLVLNYVKHREITQGKPGSHAERQRRYRERVANRDASVTRKGVTGDEMERHKQNEKVTRDTEAEAEEERAEKSKIKNNVSSSSGEDDRRDGKAEKLSLTPPTSIGEKKAQRLRQVTVEAIAAFNAKLGKPNGCLASVSLRVGLSKREQQVARILRTAGEICEEQYGSKRITAEFWEAYFAEIDRDPFKSGRGEPGRGHERWMPTFEYLTREKTMLEVFDAAQSADDAA